MLNTIIDNMLTQSSYRVSFPLTFVHFDIN